MFFEAGEFDGSSLMKEGVCFELERDQRGALVGIFRRDIVADCSAFIEDEPIVVLIFK